MLILEKSKSPKNKKKIVFFGTPEFAVSSLHTLLTHKDLHVVGVVTQPPKPQGRNLKVQISSIHQFAIDHQLEVIHPLQVNDPEVLSKISLWKADSAVVLAYGQILSNSLLSLFQKGCVNLHASLLPRFRGAAPIQRAILSGDEITGVTLQVMVEKLDAGPILGTRNIKIHDMDTTQLMALMSEKNQELINHEFIEYLNGKLTPIAQDESLATYAKKIQKSEGKINWAEDAISIWRKVRAFSQGPSCFTTLQSKKIKILKCFPLNEDLPIEQSRSPQGTLYEITKNSLIIVCGKGLLEITKIQPESKSALSIKDYLRGNPLKKGVIFE